MIQAPAPLSKLIPHIRILVLDDKYEMAKATATSLNQQGYQNVDIVTNPKDALERLQDTNILLTDLRLKTPGWDGLRVCRDAKQERKDQIEVIIYSAETEELPSAAEHGAIAFFTKPLQFDYLKIWIDEIAKRIWLEKILDTMPDEIIVVDIKDFGHIHYVNEAKKKVFAKYHPLVGKYCYQCFEVQKEDGPCPGCPAHLAAKKGISLRKEWSYISTVDEKPHSAGVHVAPLKDENGKKVAVVESVRDRTDRMHIQQKLAEIEREQDWQKRVDTFLKGFTLLGFERVRFYRRKRMKNKDCFHGVKSLGMPKSFDIKSYSYEVDSDRPTRYMIRHRKPLLFIVDQTCPERKLVPSRTYDFLYKVGESYVQHNHILRKKRWIELPIFANRRVIAKVSADPKADCFITSYDLEMLSFYAMSAGQAIYNAQQRAKLNAKTQKAIIKIAQRISRLVSTKHILREAVRQVCSVMDVAQCSIFLLSESDNKPMLRRETSYYISKSGKRGYNIDFDENYSLGRGSMTGTMFERRKDRYLNNLSDVIADEKSGKTRGAISLSGTRNIENLLEEPLRNGMFAILQTESRAIGMIRVSNKRRPDDFGNYEFDDDDLVAFQALAGQIAIAIEYGRLVDRMKKLGEDRIEIIENYSHTLKNRVQPLLTRAELLYSKKKGDDERSWRTLLDGFHRLQTVINTMLQLSKAEVGKPRINPVAFDLHRLVQSVLSTYEVYLKDKKMKFDYTGNKVIVTWDKQMIYDAIANLVDNAIKYGEKGASIKIDQVIGKRRVAIAVTNTGDTIPARERKNIFKKYYSSKELVENMVSIGLGLPYVHLISRAHKGRILYDHRFTGGARFVMVLPYRASSS